MRTGIVQLLAALIGAAHVAVSVLLTRWERPGRAAPLRVRLRVPVLVWLGYLVLVVPLLYPVVVAITPRWGYSGPLNWSSPLDVWLQGIGLGLWVAGIIVLIWAARVMRRYMAVDGVTEDHELVASGPYRYVRHPVYGSFSAVAVGLTLVFRSYLLAGVAASWVAASTRWAATEEGLLSSADGLGEVYRTYRAQTGRFLPRLRRVRR